MGSARRAVRSAPWALLLWLAACAAPVDPASAQVGPPGPIAIAAAPVALFPDDPQRTRLGHLIYRGGVSLTAPSPRFGGWSDLRVHADGWTLTAVSDQAAWLQATIEFDARGNLAGLARARFGPLSDLGGRPLVGFRGDAEGLADLPDGGFAVAFERRHRLWVYPAAEPPFSARPRALAPPPGLAGAPANGGIEALIRLADGRFLALTEDLVERDARIGWIGDGRTWRGLTYRAADGFSPTAAAQLPGGDLVILERRFTLFGGWAARLTRVPIGRVLAGARLEGTEIARFEPPLTVDNFEGLAVARGAGGETLLFVLSDDNFRALQRTLLLMFELPD